MRSTHRDRLALFAAALCLAAAGCTGSRWARSHPDYAAKYPHHTGNLARMTKQAVDARHVAGDTGFYAGAVGQDDPVAGGVNAGMFHYPDLYAGSVELHGGFQGLLAEGDHPLTGGIDAGIRLQTPSRLAPFVGVGAYVGSAPGEPDEGEESDVLLAGYPEAGVHFWVTPAVRISTTASYFFTTSEENRSYPLVGISLAYLPFDPPSEHVPAAECGDPIGIDPTAPDLDTALDACDPWPSEPWPDPAASSHSAGAAADPSVLNTAYESLVLPELN